MSPAAATPVIDMARVGAMTPTETDTVWSVSSCRRRPAVSRAGGREATVAMVGRPYPRRRRMSGRAPAAERVEERLAALVGEHPGVEPAHRLDRATHLPHVLDAGVAFGQMGFEAPAVPGRQHT